ncbi:MAG: HAD family hydrolase [Rhizobium sp.]|nr:HAD family hydrolase [Rhizobium sp.]
MDNENGKLVIFDCDGVLVDSEPISFAVLREMLADAGLAFSESWAYENFLGKSMASITELVAREHDLLLDEAALAAMRARLYERFEAELEPVHGIGNLLADFPFVHCVASSSQLERIRLCLRKTRLIDYFEPNIFSASMVANGKPAPDLFLHAARNMGFAPRNCIVIEDSPSGIRAAKAAGMTVFAFTGASHAIASNLRPIVESLKPAAIFDDMAQLPGLIAASGS